MKDWKEYSFKDITTKIGSGSTPTGGKEAYYNAGITLVRSLNIYDFEFEYKDLAFINEAQAKKLNGVTIEKDDILLNITGASVGRCTIIPEKLLPARVNQHVSIIRADKKIADSKFLLYSINSSFYKESLMLIADSGSTREALTKVDIEKFKIFLPPLPTQHRIASILSAYDDLIETNNQRIKLLEQTARELYKEWFVRMRFPNYKKIKFKKGIPEGWEVKKLGELVTTQYGYTASATNESVGLKFLRITDIADTRIDWDKVPNCIIPEKERKKYLLENGDMVVARTGATVGFAKRINKFNPPTVFASYLVRLKPKDYIFNYYLGIIVESENYKEYIQTVASGTAQPQANAGLMTGFSLFKPTDYLIRKFNLNAEPMFDQREILEQQNIQLRQIRDRLLPRLVSGKLQVKEISKNKKAVDYKL